MRSLGFNTVVVAAELRRLERIDLAIDRIETDGWDFQRIRVQLALP